MPVQQIISQTGAFTSATKNAIQANFNALFGGLLQVGNIFFCNPKTTVSVANQDGSESKPFSTLLAAYNACVSGNNDVVVLQGDGTTAGTARVDAAFTWSKNATHLLGICSPVMLSQRARIAPTATTTAFTPFFTISGNGCVFQNIQWFHGFNTGTTAMINMIVSGSRNWFKNCHIAGMGDTTSATDAGSRSLKLGGAGAGENLFEDCTVGLDTVQRSGANASVEFTGDAVRNIFRRCIFPFFCSATSPLGILGTGAACLDRFNLFEQCCFLNSLKSGGGSSPAVLVSLTSASPGGLLAFRQCMMAGITKFGDTNGLANSYIDMPAPSAAAGGLGVNPS